MVADAENFPNRPERRAEAEIEADPVDDVERTVSTTSTTISSSEQEPVVVWKAANLMEAEIVQGRLESENIPSYIRRDAVGGIYGLTFGGLAQADVLVPALLAEKALVLLDEAPDLVDENLAEIEQPDEEDATYG